MNISSVNTTAGFTTDKNISSGPSKEIISVVGTEPKTESVASNVPKGAITLTDEEKRNKLIERVIDLVQGKDTAIERSVHEGTNHIVYKVKDKETGEIIREIPEEKLLDIAAKFMELNGMVIDEKI